MLSAVSVTVLSAAFTLLEGNKVTSKLLERYEVKLNRSFSLLSLAFSVSSFVMVHNLLQTEPCYNNTSEEKNKDSFMTTIVCYFKKIYSIIMNNNADPIQCTCKNA